VEDPSPGSHPAFVANGGRMGFDAVDYARYAPEAGAPIRVIWLDAHRRRAELTAIDGLVHDELMRLSGNRLARAVVRSIHDQARASAGYNDPNRDDVELSQSALSQHLARMREEGLIVFRRESQSLWYRIADPRVEDLLATLHRLYCR